MNVIGKYAQKTHPASRITTVDACEVGQKKHTMQALIEIDVTEARELIRETKMKGAKISFTAWLIKCISTVCEEYKLVHGVKNGKYKTVVFDDVDISILVERDVHGENVPLPYVLRKTNEKSISDIYMEIKQAQQQPIKEEGDFVLGGGMKTFFMRAYYSLPGFVRRLFISRLIMSPILTKKHMGTVVISSLGMMGRFNGWFVPISIHPMSFTIGSIVKKPGIIHDTIAIREYLFVTVLIDHDVIDGAPSARALAKLIDLMEKGYGLESLTA